MKKGIVYLVGAGPGDPDLITVKGLACLQRAEVVVYDRLSSTRLLSLVPPGAELIYAGKHPTRHALTQEEINRLLIDRARQGKTVVRLKGGDPFIFGRGGEEAEALAEAGVPFEVVPGVTSASAVPAYAGIPVTHRNCASTLAVVTGNEDPSREDTRIAWDRLATGADTIVFLMGMANLESIVGQLIAHGRSPDTPAAIIQWGTLPEQKTLAAPLKELAYRAREAGLTNPAVIVVGEVVSLREKLNWWEKKPLFGRRVLITRTREQAGQLSALVREMGGEAVEFPTIRVAEPADYGPLDRAIAKLPTYRWAVFTSANGVRFFIKRLLELGEDVRALKGVGICAIGPKTREALERYALRVSYVPDEYRAEEIARGLGKYIRPGDRVLLPRADIARKVLADMLRGAGAEVEEVTAYRTLPDGENAPAIRRMLEQKEIHVVTFTSSSTVRNFVSLLGKERLPELLSRVTVACIGPVTAETARELGLPVHVTARRYTVEGLVEAIAEAARGESS